MMIELIGVHRADHRQIIGNAADMRQQLAHLHAALAMAFEPIGRRPDLGRLFLYKCEPRIADDGIGKRLPIHGS